MTLLILLILVGVLLLGGALLLLIMTRGGGRSSLNIDKYRSEWMGIEQAVARDNESSWHLAILNADKLLDKALRERGFKGQTMGERMKSAKDTWKNTNHVWTAHKLRNQIAHETNAKVTYDTTRRALEAYKQGLKDMGAI